MVNLRKIIFWSHLISGLGAGVIIAIMSITGIAIAFEQEILGWIDREAAYVAVPEGATPLSIKELETMLAASHPDFQASTLLIPRAPDAAYQFRQGRERTLFVDPYRGTAVDQPSSAAHDFLHTLEDWHRWLGTSEGNRSVGRLATGVSNLLFLWLCLSGLYLWFPRRWAWKIIRRSLWFVPTQRAKARDFNAHQVFGFWSLPVLVIVVGTGVVISFGWAHGLVFRAFGEEPAKFRDFRMMGVPAPAIEPPAHDMPRLGLDDVLPQIRRSYPEWQAIGYNVPRSPDSPIDIVAFEPAPFATAGRVQLYLHPYTGEELSRTSFADRSAGLQARVWMRFLHTGEAFGLPGKVIATLATLASLILVYTGFSLAIRRLFPRRAA